VSRPIHRGDALVDPRIDWRVRRRTIFAGARRSSLTAAGDINATLIDAPAEAGVSCA
jgi:hypothetical protein